MNNGKVDWRGNFPAAVTPFTKGGEIDEAKFSENIELLISEGVHGIVVSGANGESWAMDGDEKLRLLKLAKDADSGKVPVILGTGGIVTPKVTSLSAKAKEEGADGVMLMPPYYAKVNRREVVAHFKAISDGSKIPILLYNSPKATCVDITADFCRELAEIEYVVAIKQSCDDFVELEATINAVEDRMLVFSGKSASRGMASVLLGCVGLVSSNDPHIMGREGISLFELAAKGDIEGAKRVQKRTLALDLALSKIGTGPATMKAAMNMVGRPGGYPRPPLLELNEEEKDKVRAILDTLGILKKSAA